MLNKFLSVPFYLLLTLAVLTTPLMAQSIEFVPPGVFKATMQTASQSFDQVHTGGSRNQVSLLTKLMEQAGLTAVEITGGSLTETSSQTEFILSIGLSESWNLYAMVTEGSKSRTGTITTDLSAPALAFVSKYGAQAVAGSGDTELGFIYRPIYTDFNELRIAFGYNQYEGANQFATDKSLYIGSGTSQATLQVDWDHYLKDRKAITRVTYAGRYSTVANYNSPLLGNYIFQSGTESRLKGSYEQVFGSFHLGVNVINFTRKPDSYNSVTENNQIDSRTLGLTVGFGNLSGLEEGPVALPWMVEAEYRIPLLGTNLPTNGSMNLSASLYF